MKNPALIAKAVLVTFYLATIILSFVPSMQSTARTMSYIAGVLFAVHLVEYFTYRKRLESAAPEVPHFVNTFMFGLIHIKTTLTK